MTRVSGTASDYFASLIDEYDSLIRRAVPGYDRMLSATLEYLPPHPTRGLELGCGTGNFSVALAGRFPDCRWTMVDASDEMVALTRARLAREAPSTTAECVVTRFEELDTVGPPFDVATSCISLHHVVEKRPFFERLARAIRPGGSVCLSDQLRGETPRIADLHWRRWLAACRAPGGCTEEEIAHLIEHAEAHDHYEPLGAYAAYLEDAGFVDVDCVWRDGMWAVITAERSAGAAQRRENASTSSSDQARE